MSDSTNEILGDKKVEVIGLVKGVTLPQKEVAGMMTTTN
jgi:hypothetical protein